MFRPNQIVYLFNNPDLCTDCIGKGIVKEKTFQNNDVTMFIVKSLKTGKELQQVFYNKNRNMYLISKKEVTRN